MKHVLMSKRVAAATVASVLTAGALVATTSTPASAAPTSASYDCAIPIVGNVALPFEIDPGTLPASVPAGLPIPAGQLPVTLSTLVPASVFGLLSGLSVDMITSPDFVMGLGTDTIPVDGMALTGIVPDGVGGATLNAAGSSGAFTTPLPGVYDVTLPSQFSMIPSAAGVALPAITCATANPAIAGQIQVLKQDSTTVATPAKPKIKKGKSAKVKTTVTNLINAATGNVKVMKGSKTWGTGTLSEGKVTVTTKKFKKPGKYKLTVKYLGDAITKVSQDTVTIKVVR